jgi:F420-dependent oxidoreductase-like protein
MADPRRAAFINPGRDLASGVDLARGAESLGYDSVWVTHGSGRDSFGVLAAYGAATTRLRLGNGVVPIYPRHPVAMAQAALTLSEMTAGRFILGVGVSHRASMEAMLGLTLREPLAVMREYVAVLRGAVNGTAKFEGRHYRVNWSLAVPERPPAPPIYLAALSRNMLELAGEVADGVVLWLCSPGYVRDVAVPALQRGRARAGKTLAGFEIVAAVPLAISDDAPAALTAFRAELSRYLTLPFYRAMLESSGLGTELATFDRSGEVAEALPRALGAVGAPEAGRSFVQAYRDAGVTLPAIRPITFPDAPWYRRTLEEASRW